MADKKCLTRGALVTD